MSATAVLCLLVLGSTFSIGAFGPLLPEIARSQGLTDWQLGVVAGAFGFARMVGAVPSGWLAGRRLRGVLTVAPVLLAAALVVLGLATSFAALTLGRFLMGLAHTLAMVGALTAILQDDRGASASLRLNTFEFSGMLGILGGVTLVGLLPASWGWNLSLVVASSPLLLGLPLVLPLRRHFADAPGSAPARAPAVPGERQAGAPRATPRVVWLMFVTGAVFALSWSAVSQFLLPLRGTREFGLDRAGVSWLFAVAQAVDLAALLPVGRLADRVGRARVLGGVALAFGLGTFGVGLGSFPWFVAGCAGFGLGLAGWMLPLGVIREHTPLDRLAWRTGLYRVGVDAAVFLGPLTSGLVGARAAGVLVAAVGAAALAIGVRLLRHPGR